MSVCAQLLRDLADPAEGIYNATSLLGERLSYITTMLNKYEKLPVRAPTSSTVLGTSVPASSLESALGGGLLGVPRDAGDAADPDNDGEETAVEDDAGAGAAVSAIVRGMFAPDAEPAPSAPAAPVAAPVAPVSEVAEKKEAGNGADKPARSAVQYPADTRAAPRRTLTRVSSLDARSAAFHWPRPASRGVKQRSTSTVR